jgi:transposase
MVDWAMRPPVYVRPLTDTDETALQQGLRSSDSFTVRRCQILLASARAERAPDIARALSCGDQTVRNAIREFNAEGVASLQRESSRPKTVLPLFDRDRAEQLRALLHRSPRDFGQPTSVWTLALAARICVTAGLTPYLVSIETIRQALRLLDISWQRAKHWITSPDPAYAKKNAAATA